MIASLKLSEGEKNGSEQSGSSSVSSVEVINLNEPVPHRFEYRVVLKKSLQNFDAVLGQIKSVGDRDENEQNLLPKQTVFKKKISKNITGAIIESQFIE